MNSLIKYYGGKHYMTDIITSYFPYDYKTYVEGFGGSASVLFSKIPYGIEVYNDLDRNVYSIFKVLSDKEMFDKFRDALNVTPYSRDIWKEYKESLTTDDLSILDRAIKYFYVNRSSFNSVGGFSVNLVTRRGMPKSVSDYLSAVDGLVKYNERISRVLVENLDIFELVKKYDGKDTFFYLDPPYVHDTRKSNQRYNMEFTDDDHRRFVEMCNGIEGKVLISGYDSPIYDALEGFKKIEFKAPNAKYDATEVLWKNY